MLKKFLIIGLCLALFVTGCREPKKNIGGVKSFPKQTNDLTMVLDELSFQIFKTCFTNGYKKLFISTLASPERAQSFIAEEFLRRLYVDNRVAVMNTFELAALKKKGNLSAFSEESPLPPEWGIDSLLQVKLTIDQEEVLLSVMLVSYPEKRITLNETRQITDTTSALLTTIKDATFIHPGMNVRESIWQENFEKTPVNVGKKFGNWIIQKGFYTPVGIDDTLYDNLAIVTTPIYDKADVTFEGDCQLGKNGEGGLILRGRDLDNAIFVMFNAKHKFTGFIRRKNKREKWVSPPISYPFEETVPFHFKVITNGRNYVLFIDGLPVSKIDFGDFQEGIFGVYVKMKAGLPVLWDNLHLAI